MHETACFVSSNLTMGTLPAPHWKGRGAPLSEGNFSIQLASNKYEVLMKNVVASAIPPPTIVIASTRLKTCRAGRPF